MKNDSSETLSIVRGYHQGWKQRHFDAATAHLAPDLRVEVPINEYRTRESFAEAVTKFGGLVQNVVMLAEFVEGNEAMVLYDMNVEHLGRMRMAEHFTVVGGKIARIRQIHDTAALRAAGFARMP